MPAFVEHFQDEPEAAQNPPMSKIKKSRHLSGKAFPLSEEGNETPTDHEEPDQSKTGTHEPTGLCRRPGKKAVRIAKGKFQEHHLAQLPEHLFWLLGTVDLVPDPLGVTRIAARDESGVDQGTHQRSRVARLKREFTLAPRGHRDEISDRVSTVESFRKFVLFPTEAVKAPRERIFKEVTPLPADQLKGPA